MRKFLKLRKITFLTALVFFIYIISQTYITPVGIVTKIPHWIISAQSAINPCPSGTAPVFSWRVISGAISTPMCIDTALGGLFITLPGISTTYPLTGAGLVACVNSADTANSNAGGICDARTLQGSITVSSAVNIGTGTGNRVELLLGCPATFTTSVSWTVQQGSSIIGCPNAFSDGTSTGGTTIAQANNANLSCIICVTGNLAILQDFTVDGNLANNTTVTNDGIAVSNAAVNIFRVTSWRSKRYGLNIISTGLLNQAVAPKLIWFRAIGNGSDGLHCNATTDMFITSSDFENNLGFGINNVDCSGMRLQPQWDVGGNTLGGIKIQGISTGWKAVRALMQGGILGNNLGHDIFLEGSCSDNVALLCARDAVITGNVFNGLGAGATANTFSGIAIQDSANNSVTGNVCASASPQTYKYCVQILQPNITEGNDSLTGNTIDATSPFGTGYFLPQNATTCAGNIDPANLCNFKIAAFTAWTAGGIPIAGATSGTSTVLASPTGGISSTLPSVAGVIPGGVFNVGGTAQTLAVHIVQDTATLAAGTITVTLSGSSIFSSATSYTCLAEDETAIAATKCLQNSGSSITITGTGTDVVRFILIGN